MLAYHLYSRHVIYKYKAKKHERILAVSAFEDAQDLPLDLASKEFRMQIMTQNEGRVSLAVILVGNASCSSLPELCLVDLKGEVLHKVKVLDSV
jgi:hypothetical protein